jgi:hypothetical protein
MGIGAKAAGKVNGHECHELIRITRIGGGKLMLQFVTFETIRTIRVN